MSDEDRDIDIESDDDVDEEANTQFMTQAEKRAHHNALERKRRDHIKESFHNLRDSIPSVQGEKVGSKASRAQILKQATDYIQFMTKKNGTTQSDIDDLKKQNSLLEQQIRALEKAKTTSSFASQSSSLLSSGGKIGMAHDSESESSDTEVAGSRKKKLKTK
ncbi:hypothetical protein CAPTEDRAFT_118760 [Capitella teleta]|uniref:Protein max n=1 Tax=Capitella teleta TaxID=283909 RepID=R7T5M6_CAPTE|nr:hypothetical protein CAPTEDRAFT_118760 [Capitella teleta]|eukprot:ELT88674.1 hypothetical protein CAPTEDRAFT_118760 [Capitella teleta]